MYNLYSENGYVQDVANNKGWWDTISALTKLQTGELVMFAQEGKTVNPKGVIADIDKLLPQINYKKVKDILESLREGLTKCQEIAIISE